MIDREDVTILFRAAVYGLLLIVAVALAGAALGISWALFEATRGLT